MGMGKRTIRDRLRNWKLTISYNLKDCPDRSWDERIIGLVGSEYLRFARSGRYSRNWMFEVVEFGFWIAKAKESIVSEIEAELIRLRGTASMNYQIRWEEGGRSGPPSRW